MYVGQARDGIPEGRGMSGGESYLFGRVHEHHLPIGKYGVFQHSSPHVGVGISIAVWSREATRGDGR